MSPQKIRYSPVTYAGSTKLIMNPKLSSESSYHHPTRSSYSSLSSFNVASTTTTVGPHNKPLQAPKMAEGKKIAYGTFSSTVCSPYTTDYRPIHMVRLGNSGLKVSQIILGCMSYGSPEWQKWVSTEEESIKHIKAA